jgi:hypothetical protein
VPNHSVIVDRWGSLGNVDDVMAPATQRRNDTGVDAFVNQPPQASQP